MEDRAHALIAIAFLIVLGGGAAALVIWMQSGPAEAKVYEIVTSYDVAGLAPEAPVRFRGVQVGRVRDVGLDPNHPQEVRIRLTLVGRAPVTHSTYAEIGSEGLTGQSYVALDDSGSSTEPLETSAKHPAKIPMRRGLLQSLEHSSRRLLAEANQVVQRFGSLLDESNRAHIAQTLAQLDQATAKLVALEKGLAPTVEHLPRLAAETRRTVKESRALIERLRSDAEALRAVERSAGAAGQQLSSETLPRIDALIRDLGRTVQHVDALAQELQRTPQSLLLGAPPPQPGPGEPGFETPSREGSP